MINKREERVMNVEIQKLYRKVQELEDADICIWGGILGIRESIHIATLFEILFHYLGVELKKSEPYPYKLEKKKC